MADDLTAEQILELLPKELLAKLLEQGLRKQLDQTRRVTIEELIRIHKEYIEAKEFCEGTVLAYRRVYIHLKEYSKSRGIKYADEVTYDHAEEYYNYLKKNAGKNNNPSRRHVIIIYKQTKAIFGVAERRGYIQRNRFENKVYPTSQVSEWWTDEYVSKLIDAVNKHAAHSTRYKTVLKILLTYTTGLRAGIIHRIRRKDVIFSDDGSLYLNTKAKVPKSAAIQRVTTPILNKKTEEMITNHVNKLDKRGIKPDQYIFTKGKPKSGYKTYCQTLRSVCRKAGLPYLSPHKAKHGFITKMAQNGLSAEQICRMTGNLTPSLIQKVYMHLQIGDVRAKVEKLIGDF